MDLYIASKSDRADIVKIGRSNNPTARCASLQESQPFRVVPSVVFAGMGQYEAEVHQALKRRRVDEGPSREWFACELPEAIRLVTDVLYPNDPKASRKVNGTWEPSFVERVKDWIEQNTMPTNYREASLQADVRAAIGKSFDLDRRDFVTVADLAGLKFRRQKRRLFAYQYLNDSKSKFVKLIP